MDGTSNNLCTNSIDPYPQSRTCISPTAVFRCVTHALVSLKTKLKPSPPELPLLSYYYTPTRRRQIKEYQSQITLGLLSKKPWTPEAPTFTLFPMLPVELRLRIWHHCLKSPRIISFLYFTSPQRVAMKLNIWRCHRKWASLLLVNKESYYEARKLVYGWLPGADNDVGLISWKVDIVYLLSPDAVRFFKALVEQKIFRDPDKCPRRLALNLTFEGRGPNVAWQGLEKDLWVLSQLFVLEEVIFVMKPMHEGGSNSLAQRFCELSPGDFDPAELHGMIERLFDSWIERSRKSGPLRWQKPRIAFAKVPER